MRNELPKAIEQYQSVAKDWPGTPEADEARRFAEALKDPQAAAFYKELYAYSPTKMTLPPDGTETLPSPSAVRSSISDPVAQARPRPRTDPLRGSRRRRSRADSAIPGVRDARSSPRPRTLPGRWRSKPKARPPSRPRPKADAPAAKPAESKKDMPADVFAPKKDSK